MQSKKKAFFKIILSYNFKNIFLKKGHEHLELLKDSVNFILSRLYYPHNLNKPADSGELNVISSSKKKGILIFIETELVLNDKSIKNMKDLHINPDFIKSIKLVKAYDSCHGIGTVGPDIK